MSPANPLASEFVVNLGESGQPPMAYYLTEESEAPAMTMFAYDDYKGHLYHDSSDRPYYHLVPESGASDSAPSLVVSGVPRAAQNQYGAYFSDRGAAEESAKKWQADLRVGCNRTSFAISFILPTDGAAAHLHLVGRAMPGLSEQAGGAPAAADSEPQEDGRTFITCLESLFDTLSMGARLLS